MNQDKQPNKKHLGRFEDLMVNCYFLPGVLSIDTWALRIVNIVVNYEYFGFVILN